MPHLVPQMRVSGTLKRYQQCQSDPNSTLAYWPQLKHDLGMLEKHSIAIADVRVPLKRKKTLDEAKVQKIAESIIDDGQLTPIQVRADGAGFVLVEGLHRLEALRVLGETAVDAYLVRARLH